MESKCLSKGYCDTNSVLGFESIFRISVPEPQQDDRLEQVYLIVFVCIVIEGL